MLSGGGVGGVFGGVVVATAALSMGAVVVVLVVVAVSEAVLCVCDNDNFRRLTMCNGSVNIQSEKSEKSMLFEMSNTPKTLCVCVVVLCVTPTRCCHTMRKKSYEPSFSFCLLLLLLLFVVVCICFCLNFVCAVSVYFTAGFRFLPALPCLLSSLVDCCRPILYGNLNHSLCLQ